MSRPKLPVPEPLSRAAQRFQEWRRHRTTRRIPDGLWLLAADLGRQFGINRTARALGIPYASLKAHLHLPEPAGRGGREVPTFQPSFVEVMAPTPSALPGWVIELENPAGAKLRIQVRGSGLPDLALLTRLFLEAGA